MIVLACALLTATLLAGLGVCLGLHAKRERVQNHALQDAWRTTAAQHGLKLRYGKRIGQLELHGRIGDLDVLIRTDYRVEYDEETSGAKLSPNEMGTTEFRVSADTMSSADITMLPSNRRARFGNVPKQRLVLGDIGFDSEVRVFGDELEAAAVLTSNTRRLARRVISSLGGEYREGGVIYREMGHCSSAARLSRLIRVFCDLTNRLRLNPNTVPERLAENTFSEPDSYVRRNTFRQLLGHYYPLNTTAALACHRGLGHRDPMIRALSSMILPQDEALKVLHTIIFSPTYDLDARKCATELVIRHVDNPTTDDIMIEVLGECEPEIQGLAVYALRYARSRTLRVRLVEALPSLVAPRVVVTAIDSLEALGETSAEGALIDLLDSNDIEVQLAAARALGSLGSSASVDILIPKAEGHWLPGEMNDRLWETVAEIQARSLPPPPMALLSPPRFRADLPRIEVGPSPSDNDEPSVPLDSEPTEISWGCQVV